MSIPCHLHFYYALSFISLDLTTYIFHMYHIPFFKPWPHTHYVAFHVGYTINITGILGFYEGSHVIILYSSRY